MSESRVCLSYFWNSCSIVRKIYSLNLFSGCLPFLLSLMRKCSWTQFSLQLQVWGSSPPYLSLTVSWFLISASRPVFLPPSLKPSLPSSFLWETPEFSPFIDVFFGHFCILKDYLTLSNTIPILILVISKYPWIIFSVFEFLYSFQLDHSLSWPQSRAHHHQ